MSHNIKSLKKQRGIVKYVFYILILVLILSYFGFNIKSFMNSDSVQNNLSYVWDWIINIWKHYLKPIYDFISSWLGPYISDTLDGLKNHNYDLTKNISKDLIPKIK